MLRLWNIECMLAFCVFVPLAAGCGKSPPTVHGTVTWNGKPVESGTVRFVTRSDGSETVLSIQNGNYSSEGAVPPSVGENRVEIRAHMKTGEKKTVPKVDAPITSGETETIELTRQVLPVEFNDHSSLVREIKAGGNEINFDLKGVERTR